MINLKDTTFIIPLRIESADRMRNVITSVCYLLSNFDTNIIVKEGDSSTVFLHHVLPQVKEFLEVEDIPNLTHVFEDTSASEFHRTRYLNEMTHMATTKVVVNYDCDIILPLGTYIKAQEMIIDGPSDVVYPYGFGNYARMAQVDDEIVSEFLSEGFSIDLLESKSATNNARFGFINFRVFCGCINDARRNPLPNSRSHTRRIPTTEFQGELNKFRLRLRKS